MVIEFITKEELELFRKKLLADFKDILNQNAASNKEWLRGRDVMKMLKISEGTLQSLRVSGKLKFKKIGGIYFYQLADINLMLGGGVK
jgi:hypothetical protein